MIMINHNRCILCYRCVRVCDEQMGVHALDVSDRGSKSFIVTAQHKFMDCERCGMCVEVCPVGAVLSRPFKHQARAWQTVQTQTTCPHCSVGCQLQLESRKGSVLRARARPVAEPTKGSSAARGSLAGSTSNSPDRIAAPMIRRRGELVEVSWPEAIEHVGDSLLEIAAARDPIPLLWWQVTSSRSRTGTHLLAWPRRTWYCKHLPGRIWICQSRRHY